MRRGPSSVGSTCSFASRAERAPCGRPATAQADSRPNLGARILRSRETGIVGALVIMVVALSIFAPDFASVDNLLNDARNFSFVGIVVLGQAMVMITGGIDLSVGSVWGLSAVSSAALMAAGWPVHSGLPAAPC